MLKTKVCIASAGRFHTFDLARQMERLGHLSRLYTGYPKWKVDGLPRERIRSNPWLLSSTMILGRWGFRGARERMRYLATEKFDQWMATRLEPCDVFHCLSSFGTRAHQVARDRYRALTVCDRGSSHILYQDEIMAEEYARWGLPYKPIDRRAVERELQEYTECDVITTPSHFTYNSFLRKGVPKKKLVTIPYGIDLRLFRPIAKEDDIFRVIYVGAISLRKGIPYLLKALSELRLSKFELWLIGGMDPEVKPLLVKFKVSYRYLGVIPRTELYTGISILSFPFTRKPMPATLSCQPQTALASLR